MEYATDHCYPAIIGDFRRSCEAKALPGTARFCECPELIVKGKRISYRPQSSHLDPAKWPGRFEHGFPLMRSLRALAPRSTSVMFSFVLSLLIVAAPFAIRQSKTILAQSCAALARLFTCACKSRYRGGPKVRYSGRLSPDANTIRWPPVANSKISPPPSRMVSATKRLPAASKAMP